MIDFLKSLGLLKVAIGFIVGILVAGTYHVVDLRKTTKANDEKFKLFSTMTAQSVITASEMREENERLRKRSKTIERTNKDGSVERISEVTLDSDTNSSTETYTRQIAMLEHTIKSLKETHSLEQETIKSSSKSYSLHGGIDFNGEKYIMGTYPVWSIIEGHGQVLENGKIGIGLGLRFNF